MTTFDPAMFDDLTAEGAMSTKYEPIPEGEYEAIITDVSMSVINTDDGPRPVARLTWEIVGPNADELRERLGRQTLTVSQTVFLDIEEQNGRPVLATGKNKNVQLGRIREALGQNKGGKWGLSKLQNAGPAKILVKHSAAKDDPETIYTNVRNVQPL